MKLKLHIVLLALLFCQFSQAQKTEFYGMTKYGGTDNLGVIFKTDSNGENQTVLQNFVYTNPGKRPAGGKLCEVNGKLYGTTTDGGIYNMGVLYEYDPSTKTYLKLHDFDGVNTGDNPYFNVILASNGKLYGTTAKGGINDSGTFFEYNILTNKLIKKFDFEGGISGGLLLANVIQASNGKLYGTTNLGGENYAGILFEYDYAAEVFTKLIDFESDSLGIAPNALLETQDNILYGTCSGGGVNKSGTIFKYNISTNTISKKFDFDNVTSGSAPSFGLLKAANGVLYGLTRFGGINYNGVMFEYDILNEIFTKKLDFSVETGNNPFGGLLEASDGNLYGQTLSGGSNNSGTIFNFNLLTDTFTKKFDFAFENGITPYGTFVQASNGKLYATTAQGGASDFGTLFEYDLDTDNFTKEFNFSEAEKGSAPNGSLIKSDNGKFYGLTSVGGTNNMGVLFEFDPIENMLIKKADFNGINGSKPFGSLIQASNSKVYGMTVEGGVNNVGVIFEFDTKTDALIKKVDFNGLNGSKPFGNLILATNSKLYGMTSQGGELEGGVLFEYDPINNNYTNKFNFSSNTNDNGSYPFASLLQASNGNLYGLTVSGGKENLGVLFEYNITNNSYTKKHDFITSEGNRPFGSLIQALNGKLYGTTREGGSKYNGVLFEFDPETGGYIDKISFEEKDTGSLPIGDLLQATNGKMYGMTSSGGARYCGTLFEYDPVTEIINKKLDFNNINGCEGVSSLTEVNVDALSISDNNSLNTIRIYPNPVSDKLVISSKNRETFQITIFNILGSQVFHETRVDNNDQIKLDHLQSGLFILKAISKNGNIETIKFIKN